MRVFQIENDWGVDNLKLAQRPEPKAGPGEVLLRMKASSLNARDLLVPERGYGRATGTLPLIPVSDGVGEVVEAGEGVTRFSVGDRVCPMYFQGWISGDPSEERFSKSLGGPLDGTMTEYMRVSEHGAVRVPKHLTDQEAAALPCAALTAWSALITRGRIQPGEKVLIQGSGGVALFALAFARMAGAHVTVISSSDEKIERLRGLGADATINYRRTPDWHKASREITNGRGYDHILELGGELTFPKSLACIRTGGTISLIGVLSGLKITGSLGYVVTRQVRLQGITVGHRDGFEAMARAMELHKIKPVLDREFSFEGLKEALAYLKSGRHFGKVIVMH
jgi:NADPH:quinone reductase-like Zn-dependent oxidoreductase